VGWRNVEGLESTEGRGMIKEGTKYVEKGASEYKSDMSRLSDYLDGSYCQDTTSMGRLRFSPIQNIMRYRSTPSPSLSRRAGCRSVSPGEVSQKSRESIGKLEV